jgi:hypothetical protein
MEEVTVVSADLRGLVVGIDSRLERLDRRLDALEERYDRRFDAIDRRFEAIDGRLLHVDGLFRWVIGIQFATLLAIVAGAFSVIAALAQQ